MNLSYIPQRDELPKNDDIIPVRRAEMPQNINPVPMQNYVYAIDPSEKNNFAMNGPQNGNMVYNPTVLTLPPAVPNRYVNGGEMEVQHYYTLNQRVPAFQPNIGSRKPEAQSRFTSSKKTKHPVIQPPVKQPSVEVWDQPEEGNQDNVEIENKFDSSHFVTYTSTACCVMIFLMMLVFNYLSFNGRCVSKGVIPDNKRVQPFVLPFGHGGCLHTLGESYQDMGFVGKSASDMGYSHPRYMKGSMYPVNAPIDGPNPRVLNILGGLDTNYIRNYNEWFRLLSSMWLHSSVRHLGFNMLGSASLLWFIEPDFGIAKTSILYLLSGVTGNLYSAALAPCSITVGQSGAMYGIFGSNIIWILEYWHSLPHPGILLLITIILAVVGFATGLAGQTDNYAHGAGWLAGIIFSLATVRSFDICSDEPDFVFEAVAEARLKDALRQLEHSDEPRVDLERNRGDPTLDIKRGRRRAYHAGKQMGHKALAQLAALKALYSPRARREFKHNVGIWIIRIFASLLLLAFIALPLAMLYMPEVYELIGPLGHIKFKGFQYCECCHVLAQANAAVEGVSKTNYHPNFFYGIENTYWCFETPELYDFFCKSS